jgi:DNA-binding NarL/FixJ family response regulator
MPTMNLNLNLKVVIMDSDYYALQAINSYLAWDRRTRVTCLALSPDGVWSYLNRIGVAEQPNIILLDPDHLGGSAGLQLQLELLRRRVKKLACICMGRTLEPELIETAAMYGARGYFIKSEVASQIAWGLVYTLDHDFTVSRGIDRNRADHPRLRNASALPRQRDFPELTGRIRQAIELCVLRGMPAQLAADEMGISLHTIRSYIKEGYRILEAHDDTRFPDDFSPQERAFMRLTSFVKEE